MKFEISSSNKFRLFHPQFKTNSTLGDVEKPFCNKSNFFYIIVGKPGSGKTSLMINMISHKHIYAKKFDKVILVMPSHSISSLRKNIFESLPSEQIFDEIEPSEIMDMIEMFRMKYKEWEKDEEEQKLYQTLIIFDDVTSQLKKTDNQEFLYKICANRRHLRLSIIILSQTLRAIPRQVRYQISHVIYFKPSNKLDLETLRDEYTSFSKPEFVRLCSVIYRDSHDFLMVCGETGEYYQNLNRINISL